VQVLTGTVLAAVCVVKGFDAIGSPAANPTVAERTAETPTTESNEPTSSAG
jgi:hypothetical protein